MVFLQTLLVLHRVVLEIPVLYILHSLFQARLVRYLELLVRLDPHIIRHGVVLLYLPICI
nr:MAG TPA: hypothetical protein [Caudoviricetes sp.]